MISILTCILMQDTLLPWRAGLRQSVLWAQNTTAKRRSRPLQVRSTMISLQSLILGRRKSRTEPPNSYSLLRQFLATPRGRRITVHISGMSSATSDNDGSSQNCVINSGLGDDRHRECGSWRSLFCFYHMSPIADRRMGIDMSRVGSFAERELCRLCDPSR